jgi:hypothetical protein
LYQNACSIKCLLNADVCGDVGELLHRLAGHGDGEDVGDDLAPTVHEVAPADLDDQLAAALLRPGLLQELQRAAVVNSQTTACCGNVAWWEGGEPGTSLPIPVAFATRLDGGSAARSASVSAGPSTRT